MHSIKAIVIALSIAPLAAACSATGSSGPGEGGSARVSLEGSTWDVSGVTMMIEPGEDAWFRIEGEPATNPHEDCVPGLGGGLGLYGDLPSSVGSAADLAGKRLQVEFSGDGDDANFCFAGMGGLAGAENAWITIESVDDDRVTFSMTGSFRIYDDEGEGPVKTASASGTAVIQRLES